MQNTSFKEAFTTKKEVFIYFHHSLASMRPEQKVLKAYFDQRTTRLYFNQLKRLSLLGDSSLSATLKKLQEQRLLIKEQQTALTYYRLTTIPSSFISFDQERYQQLPKEVRYPLQAFLDKAPSQLHSILLFGSSSRSEHRKQSDIDLLIITHYFDDPELQERYEKTITKHLHDAKRFANAQSNHSLSLFIITTKDLKEPDALTKQALTTGFPIKGHQQFYDEARA